jgi:GNAT superfamily N-acetyltransferase
MKNDLLIRSATSDDVPLIFDFIKKLARYEKLEHEVVATEETLRQNLFGERQVAEVIFGYHDDKPVAFALFFHNFSTFLGQPGIYLEDLFVNEDQRGKGFGKKMLAHLAKIAQERGCGRLEWWVLDWNKPAIDFYQSLGAQTMDEWTVFRVTGKALGKLAQNHEDEENPDR